MELDQIKKLEQQELNIDAKQYIGMKTIIKNIETGDGDFGKFVRLETDVIDLIGDREPKYPLKASRLFSLYDDGQGNLGWLAKSNLGVFMEKMKCNSLKELIGKEVIVQTVVSKKNGKEYLTF